jgi:hypothetical protein
MLIQDNRSCDSTFEPHKPFSGFRVDQANSAVSRLSLERGVDKEFNKEVGTFHRFGGLLYYCRDSIRRPQKHPVHHLKETFHLVE